MDALQSQMTTARSVLDLDSPTAVGGWRRPDWNGIWPLLLALVLMAVLLGGLTAVVQNGVQSAAQRHAETASRADASWRCNAIADARQRRECRQRADAVHAAVPLR